MPGSRDRQAHIAQFVRGGQETGQEVFAWKDADSKHAHSLLANKPESNRKAYAALAKSVKEELVVIDADGQVPTGHVIRLVAALRSQGIASIEIAATCGIVK